MIKWYGKLISNKGSHNSSKRRLNKDAAFLSVLLIIKMILYKGMVNKYFLNVYILFWLQKIKKIYKYY